MIATDKPSCNLRINPLPLPCAEILPTIAVDSSQISTLNIRKTSANDVFEPFKEGITLPLRAATLSRISGRRSSAASALAPTMSQATSSHSRGASSNLRALDLKSSGSTGTQPLSGRASLPSLRQQTSLDALRGFGRKGITTWMAQATINENENVKKGIDVADGVPFKKLQRIIKLESRFKNGKPLLAPGRLITHHGTLWEEASSGRPEKKLVYILSDIIVVGKPIPRQRRTSNIADLENQVITYLLDAKVEAVDAEKPKFIISTKQGYQCLMVASDVSDRDVWMSTLSMQIRRCVTTAARQAREAENENFTQRNSSFSLDGSSIFRAISPFPSAASRKGSVASMRSIAEADVAWVPDEDALTCMVCQTSRFGLMTRKHHCRICGRVICWKCSLLVHPEDVDRPLRACIDCVSNANLTCDALPAGQDRLSISSVANDFLSPPTAPPEDSVKDTTL